MLEKHAADLKPADEHTEVLRCRSVASRRFPRHICKVSPYDELTVVPRSPDRPITIKKGHSLHRLILLSREYTRAPHRRPSDINLFSAFYPWFRSAFSFRRVRGPTESCH